MHDPKQQDRLKNLYGVEFISEEELTKDIEEAERLEKREIELAAKWIEHHNADQSVPEEPSGDIP